MSLLLQFSCFYRNIFLGQKWFANKVNCRTVEFLTLYIAIVSNVFAYFAEKKVIEALMPSCQG